MFKTERIIGVREAFDQLSKPMQIAVRLRLDGMRPSYIARYLGLTTSETRELLAAAFSALST